MTFEFRPAPKPPARQKKPRQWGSTLSVSKGLPKKRKTPRRPRELECREFLDYLKILPCFLTGNRTGDWVDYQGVRICVEVDPAHLVKSKGARGGDLGFALPLANHIHIGQQHQMGIQSWRRFHGLTEQGIRDLAALYADEFLRRFPEYAATEEDDQGEGFR